jgi:hypothetical protein
MVLWGRGSRDLEDSVELLGDGVFAPGQDFGRNLSAFAQSFDGLEAVVAEFAKLIPVQVQCALAGAVPSDQPHIHQAHSIRKDGQCSQGCAGTEGSVEI